MAKYTKHHKMHSEGHIYLGDKKEGACTITLNGSVAMFQEELDFYGNFFAEKLKEIKIPDFKEKILTG